MDKIISSLKLSDYYETEMEKPYVNIAVSLKNEIDKIPIGNVLSEFWEVPIKNRGILYPNPLDAYSRGYGGIINGVSTSISGPGKYNQDKNTVEFTGVTTIPTFIHEFSHGYAKKLRNTLTDLDSNSYQKKVGLLFEYAKKQLKDLNKLSLLSDYNNQESFFEEHIVRAAETVFITPKVFINHWSEEKISNHIEGYLRSDKNQGFIFIEDVVEVFKSVLKNKGSIKEAWVKTIDRCYDKYIGL